MEEFPQQLWDATSNLEIGFLECTKLIALDDRIETAAWCYDPDTKYERILFNPRFLEELDGTECEIVLRHEIQHKALFKELARQDLDSQLLNIALDIGISRVLSRCFDKEVFAGFCTKIYGRNPGNVNSPLALAWFGLNPQEISNKQVRDFYRQLWKAAKDPSPIEIYYKLLEIVGFPEEEAGGPGARGRGRRKKTEQGPQESSGTPGGKANQRVTTGAEEIGRVSGRDLPADEEKPAGIRDIPADILDRLPEDTSPAAKVLENNKILSPMRTWLQNIEVEKEWFETREIEEFIRRIESVDVLHEAADTLLNSMAPQTRIKVYPYNPTRLGHIYMRAGISQILHQYWNKENSARIPRLNIYVDVSPSMEAFRKQEVYLMDRMRDLFPSTFFVFGDYLKEFVLADFAQGEYPVSSGTNFDLVIAHLIESPVECGVIFTDGESYVSRTNSLAFSRSRKRLFTVYFGDSRGHAALKSDLDALSEEVLVVRI